MIGDHQGAGRQEAGRQNGSLARLERDAALARVGRTRRWAIAGAAALSAGFTAVASAAVPGRTIRPQGAATALTPAHAPASTRMPPLQSASALGLLAPSQAPQPAPDQSQAAPPQPAPEQSAPQAAPAQSQAPPPPAPAPAPAAAPQGSGGGAVVSGGS